MIKEPVVKTANLGFSVSGNRILRGIDLEVREGEFLGIIGPNGAGKTTLLRLLLGIYTPSEGVVKMMGKSLTEMNGRERAKICSYLSQDVITTFPYPVIDIILMGRYPYLTRFSAEKEQDLEIARRALSYVGMSRLEDRYFNELSGGERQLVLFAKVLAQESRILVLDEPTSNLDIKHQDQFFSMALELTGEKKAVLAAVHNLDIASQYCSRLLLLEEGRIAAEGRPDEILKSDILDRVYRTETIVSRNSSTGSLVVNVMPSIRKKRHGKIHLIGGAGSAVNLTRELLRLGYTVTGGIAHQYDADTELWNNLGIPHGTVSPFAAVTEREVMEYAHFVDESDLTVLCEFPIGPGNLANLKLAERAERCIILTGTPAQKGRAFYVPEGKERFEELSGNCKVMDYREFLSAMEKGDVIKIPE